MNFKKIKDILQLMKVGLVEQQNQELEKIKHLTETLKKSEAIRKKIRK